MSYGKLDDWHKGDYAFIRCKGLWNGMMVLSYLIVADLFLLAFSFMMHWQQAVHVFLSLFFFWLFGLFGYLIAFFIRYSIKIKMKDPEDVEDYKDEYNSGKHDEYKHPWLNGFIR